MLDARPPSGAATNPVDRYCLLERRTRRGNQDPAFLLNERVPGPAKLFGQYMWRPHTCLPDRATNVGSLVE